MTRHRDPRCACFIVRGWGFRKPELLPERPRELTAEVCENLAAEVNFRLRQLNDWLLEMLK